jgi:hypothetical protein
VPNSDRQRCVDHDKPGGLGIVAPQVKKVEDCIGPEVDAAVAALKNGEVRPLEPKKLTPPKKKT